MRLKNTKLLEDAANNDLANAYTDPNPGQKLAQQQSATSGKGKRNMGGAKSGTSSRK